MKIIYTTMPATDWLNGKATEFLARTVHEAEPAAPKPTGLLDANGVKIYRTEERDPVGFVRFR